MVSVREGKGGRGTEDKGKKGGRRAKKREKKNIGRNTTNENENRKKREKLLHTKLYKRPANTREPPVLRPDGCGAGGTRGGGGGRAFRVLNTGGKWGERKRKRRETSKCGGEEGKNRREYRRGRGGRRKRRGQARDRKTSIWIKKGQSWPLLKVILGFVRGDTCLRSRGAVGGQPLSAPTLTHTDASTQKLSRLVRVMVWRELGTLQLHPL